MSSTNESFIVLLMCVSDDSDITADDGLQIHLTG